MGVELHRPVTSSMQQVRLAEANPAVKKEGVVLAARVLGNRHGGRVGEAVRRPHDIRAENIPRMQSRAARWCQSHLGGLFALDDLGAVGLTFAPYRGAFHRCRPVVSLKVREWIKQWA